MIPTAQISLQEGLLTQNPGYEEGDDWQFTNGDLPYYGLVN